MTPTAPSVQNQQISPNGQFQSPGVTITIDDVTYPNRPEDYSWDTSLPPPSYEEVMTGSYIETNQDTVSPTGKHYCLQGSETTHSPT